MKRAAVLTVAALGALFGVAWWHDRGVPVALPEARVARLHCASYAPFRRPGQTPFTKGIVASPAEIDADLALLATRTACVRTYSVDQGLAEVPRLARKHGLRVLLGLWIGRDRAENERELERGLAVIRRDADVIDAVIVGNEVLLRRELPTAELAKYIRRVAAATPLPVTYGDVWEFWLRNRELAGAVAFVTVHLLPYWEDEPVPIDRAVEHLLWAHAQVRAAFPDKEILVGEAGWPSQGRQRRGAVPSLVNQARFVRELTVAAAAEGLRYSVMEAFDQPWKRRLEGTVGGYWGLLDADGRAKFPLHGAVAEDPRWMRGIVAAAVGALAFVLAALLTAPRPSAAGASLLALYGAAAGAALCAQLNGLVARSRDALEWAVGGASTALAIIATMMLAVTLAHWIAGRPPLRPLPAAAVVDRLRAHSAGERWLGACRFALLFAAAVVALALAFDPRYRDFPLALFAPPALGFGVLAWVAPSPVALEERVLAAVLAAASLVIVFREGLANTEALAWSALCLVLAGSAWRTRAHGDVSRQHEETEEKSGRTGLDRVEQEPRDAEASRDQTPS
ncbi:MAG TPA: glycosyl hydrolase family 17 protein [Burkholderiales bacterium]|nr:glycosyl hydrolase family 17 protein [Burkholderiales bacterium]